MQSFIILKKIYSEIENEYRSKGLEEQENFKGS